MDNNDHNLWPTAMLERMDVQHLLIGEINGNEVFKREWLLPKEEHDSFYNEYLGVPYPQEDMTVEELRRAKAEREAAKLRSRRNPDGTYGESLLHSIAKTLVQPETPHEAVRVGVTPDGPQEGTIVSGDGKVKTEAEPSKKAQRLHGRNCICDTCMLYRGFARIGGPYNDAIEKYKRKSGE